MDNTGTELGGLRVGRIDVERAEIAAQLSEGTDVLGRERALDLVDFTYGDIGEHELGNFEITHAQMSPWRTGATSPS